MPVSFLTIAKLEVNTKGLWPVEQVPLLSAVSGHGRGQVDSS